MQINKYNLLHESLQDYREEHGKLHDELANSTAVEFRKVSREFDNIQHCINTWCVCRDDTNYKKIESVIHLGDIAVLSEKKFSKFTRWLYKKLFGWTIEDYTWGKRIQRRPFYD